MTTAPASVVIDGVWIGPAPESCQQRPPVFLGLMLSAPDRPLGNICGGGAGSIGNSSRRNPCPRLASSEGIVSLPVADAVVDNHVEPCRHLAPAGRREGREHNR